MNKAVGITAGVVVVAVAGWLGATWYTGKRIETEAPAHLTKLNEAVTKALHSTGVGVQISQLSYERHFFSSHARYGIAVTELPDGEEPPKGKLELDAHIEHGPFAKGALARGNWMPKLAYIHSEIARNDKLEPVFVLTNGASPLVADTVLSYNGDGVGTAAIPPIEATSEKGQSVKFSGAQFEGSFVRATKHSIGSAKIDQVTAHTIDDDEIVDVTFNGLVLDFDSRFGQFDFGIGDSSLNIADILIEIDRSLPSDMALDSEGAQPAGEASAAANAAAAENAAAAGNDANDADASSAVVENETSDAEAPPAVAETVADKTRIALKDMGYTARVGEAGANVNFEAGYRIGQINVNGSDFGKGHATIKFDRIDGQAAQGLSDLYNDIVHDAMQGIEDESKDDAREIEAVNYVVSLLAANPVVRVDPFVWETAKGQSNLDFTVELTKPDGLVVAKGMPNNIKQLAQQAVKLIDLKVAVSKPMVQDLAAQYLLREGMSAAGAAEEATNQVTAMSGLAEMFGIAKSEGDKMVSTFHYADNKAVLNGEEVPAEYLFDALLDSLGDDDDDEGDSNVMLESIDPNLVGQFVSSLGYDYALGDLGVDDHAVEMTIDSEAAGVQIAFTFADCNDEQTCEDMQMLTTVATPRPVPAAVLKQWNQDYRLTRAYWDSDNKVVVLERVVSAYGGIGEENLKHAVQMFLVNGTNFGVTMQEATAR